jgi:hypothetical protein
MAKIVEVLADGPEKEAMVKQFGADADVAVLAKSFMETKAKLSSTGRVPGKDAKPEEWAEFYNAMGRPADPTGYDLPAEIPAAVRPLIESMRPIAHQSGIPREAFAKLAAELAGKAAASEKEVKALANEFEQRFRAANGDKAEAKMAEAKTVLERILASDPKAKEALDKSGLSSHPAIMEALLKVRSYVSDDRSPFGGGASTPGPSADKLYEEGISITQTPEYKQTNHPKHAIVAKRLRQIQADLMSKGFTGLNDKRLLPSETFTLPDGTVLK